MNYINTKNQNHFDHHSLNSFEKISKCDISVNKNTNTNKQNYKFNNGYKKNKNYNNNQNYYNNKKDNVEQIKQMEQIEHLEHLEQTNISDQTEISDQIEISEQLKQLEELEQSDQFDEKIHEKIIIPKKNFYCSNCNRKGHIYKNCLEPIISNGIIGVYIKGFNNNFTPLLEAYFNENKTNYQYIKNSPTNKNKNFHNNYNDLQSKISQYDLNPDIKFLMIQRKNSLGYLEFIRGRYNLDDKQGIVYLLEQMTPEELSDIRNKDFDYLWNNLWDKNNIKNKNHHKEYVTSKQKFYQLKMNKANLLTNTKPLFNFGEWGFPKGRRESYESDLVCAIREFEEETCYSESQYTILEDCTHIRENLVGTNGINYAHNYFIAILNEINESCDSTNREIGNIKIMDINECIDLIRPYHKNKVKIVKNVYNIINSFLLEYKNINLDMN